MTSDFNHTLAQKKDGSLWGWGRNPNGQLGDATTEKRPSSVQIGTDKDWVSIAVGQAHSIGLKSNRTLWAWGSNTYGQLGDGTTVNKNTPVQIGDKWKSGPFDFHWTLVAKLLSIDKTNPDFLSVIIASQESESENS